MPEGTFMPSRGLEQPTEVKPTPTPEQSVKPPKSHKRLIILLIVLVILIALGAGGWFAYNKYPSQINSYYSKILILLHLKTEEQKTEEQKTEEKKEETKDENTQIVEDIKKKSEIAQTEAKKKYPDAYLYSIEVTAKAKNVNVYAFQYKAFGLNPNNTYYGYSFLSPKNKKDVLVAFKIDVNNNKIEKFEDMKFSSSTSKVSPITIKELKIGYKKALEIADKNGGNEFKTQNSNITQYGLYLGNSENSLYWRLNYTGKSKSNKKKGIAIFIDAKTGSLIHKAAY